GFTSPDFGLSRCSRSARSLHMSMDREWRLCVSLLSAPLVSSSDKTKNKQMRAMRKKWRICVRVQKKLKREWRDFNSNKLTDNFRHNSGRRLLTPFTVLLAKRSQ